jgi:hypothetical protein
MEEDLSLRGVTVNRGGQGRAVKKVDKIIMHGSNGS